MPPIPSEPASMPITRKISTTGTLTRSVARLKITLMARSEPKTRRRSALAFGSERGMRESRAEGRKGGRTEGRKDGRTEGRKDGRTEGRKDGRSIGRDE